MKVAKKAMGTPKNVIRATFLRKNKRSIPITIKIATHALFLSTLRRLLAKNE
jgi:hypothetical protein